MDKDNDNKNFSDTILYSFIVELQNIRIQLNTGGLFDKNAVRILKTLIPTYHALNNDNILLDKIDNTEEKTQILSELESSDENMFYETDNLLKEEKKIDNIPNKDNVKEETIETSIVFPQSVISLTNKCIKELLSISNNDWIYTDLQPPDEDNVTISTSESPITNTITNRSNNKYGRFTVLNEYSDFNTNLKDDVNEYFTKYVKPKKSVYTSSLVNF